MANFSEIKNAYSYHEYKKLVIDYAENGKTSGNEKSPEHIEATKINAQRMKRIDKTVEINSEIKDAVSKCTQKLTWIILAESWCGDGAQNIPVIAKIAECSANIELKLLLRDENPAIMDAYLTNGSRSMPKLIAIDSETKHEIGIWGPRPVKIQQMVKEFKAQFPAVSHDEFVKNLHLWYAKDKGESLQQDLGKLVCEWVVG